MARFRDRLQDRRFWIVQALVLAITALHAAIEADTLLGHHTALYFAPVSAYLIPATYAALNFGLEGALPTAIWSGILAVPNMLLWHSGLQDAGEGLELGIMIALAVLIAGRVDRETQAKQRAEQVSARLAQLNATAAAIGRSLDPVRVVGDTLDTILAQRKVDATWIAIATGCCPEFPLITLRRRSTESALSLPGPWEHLTQHVLQDGHPQPQDLESAEPHGTDAVIVPILGGDGVLGALGVACRDCSLSIDDQSLLEAVSRQLGVALDNVHHYHEERRALGELQRAQEHLRAYLRVATNAQEEERKRLARELHDDTLQLLVTIKGSIEGLESDIRSPQAKARLPQLREMVDTTVANVLRFSRDLRPSVLDDLGLVHAIDWLVKETARRAAMDVHLDVNGDVGRLSDETAVAIFRIVQEALRNVERHSAATSATVTLTAGPDRFEVHVVDNGLGFDPRVVLGDRSDGFGLGLIGMQERAKLIGGTLEIISEPGQGTSVDLRVAITDRGYRSLGPY